MKELLKLIESNEGDKFITKQIKKALQAKKITSKESEELLDKLKKRENSKKEETNKSNYDISVEGIDPNINWNSFFVHFNAKYPILNQMITSIENDPKMTDNRLEDIKMNLAEDYMFTLETIEVVKKFTSIINEIGAALPASVEKNLGEEAKEFYDLVNKLHLHIHLYYKIFWRDNVGTILMQDSPKDYITFSKGIIPPEIYKDHNIFDMFYEEFLTPYFLVTLAQPKGTAIIKKARIGEVNSKTPYAVGLEFTKQSELDDSYIIDKVKEVLKLKF